AHAALLRTRGSATATRTDAGMKLQITHTTTYRYSQAVTQCHNEAHLRPRDHAGQSCLSSTLTVDPAPTQLHWRSDYFGNPVAYFALQSAHRSLTVTAVSRVDRRSVPFVPLDQSLPWDQLAARLEAGAFDSVAAARELTLDSPLLPRSARLRDYAA